MEGYKYLVWAPGNCASVRLAKQLAADALVLKLNSVEHEWYYPLLQPYQQFVPVWVNTTGPQGNLSLLNASSVGIAEAVRWAEGHPQEVLPAVGLPDAAPGLAQACIGIGMICSLQLYMNTKMVLAIAGCMVPCKHFTVLLRDA